MSQVSYGTITITDTNDIESITVEYNRNQSPSAAPSPTDSGWSTTRPDWAQGYYIWQRTRVHKSGTTADKDVIGTAVCITGSTGSSGTSVTISSIKYAVSTTESQPADSSFTYTSVPTVAEGSWLWTLVTYSNGSKAYMKSKQGVSGDSITVSKVEYQSGTSPTSAPTGTWQTSIPTVAEGNYLWTKTTYSDGNYTYSVAKQGKSGTSVSISSTSTTYQVSTSPTTTPTGEWKTTVQSTTTGQYLWTRTIVTYSDGNSTTSYSVAAHGATGTSISISSIKYAISSTDSQPADSSFTYTSVPTVSEGQWLWTLTTYSNGSKMYTKSKQGKSGNDGRSLTNTVTKYAHVAKNSTETQVKALAESNWTSNVPTYNENLPDYWVRITNTYDKAPLSENIYYKDNGLTDAIAQSVEANANASEALDKANEAESIATHANEDAQGALGIARAMQQNFWWWGTDQVVDSSFTLPAGAYTSDIKVDAFKVNPTGGYLVTRSDGVYLNNGRYVLMGLTGNALKFYRPGTTKLLSGTETVDAELASNGLKINNGSIVLGSTSGTAAGNVTLSNVNFSRSINNTQRDDLRLAIGSKFGVSDSGTLYADGANITNINANNISTNLLSAIQAKVTTLSTITANMGTLTAGTISYGTTGNNNSFYLSANSSKTATIAGASRSNLRLTVGSGFGVDVNGKLYATGADINGAITAQSLTIESNATISDTSGLIRNDAVEVGGRNLVWDTEWKNIPTRWTDWGTPTTREIVTLNGKQWLHLVTTANSYQGYSQNWTKREDPTSEIQAGDTIVFSYTAYAETAGQVCTVGCHWNNSSGSIVNQSWFASSLTTTPKRYTSQPFTVPENAVKFNVMIGQGVAQAQNLYITEVKIEKGNKATDWTPAPEDVDNTINNSVDAIGKDLSDFQKDFDQRLLDYDDALYNEETGLNKQLQDLGNNLKEAKEQFAILANSINGYMTFGDTSDPNQVALTLGAKSSPYKVRLTNSELQFLDGNTTPMAYMNNQSMFVQNSLSFGKFMFYQRGTHFTLKYTGGNN